MTGRKTENVTRVDIRIPNELYEQISDLAVSHFHAKIHHRSQKLRKAVNGKPWILNPGNR